LNLEWDKRNVYEFDTRIHLLIRGPGLKAGSTFAQLATNVDLAPTIMALAGVSNAVIAQASDGHSMLPLIMSNEWAADESLPTSVRGAMHAAAAAELAAVAMKAVTSLPSGAGTAANVGVGVSNILPHHILPLPMTKATWRTSIFHEYYFIGIGNYCGMNLPIEDESSNFIAVRKIVPHTESTASDVTATVPTVTIVNAKSIAANVTTANYHGGTTADGATPLSNLLYAEFQNGTGGQVDFQSPDYYELFDMDADRWQTQNIYNATKVAAPATVAELHEEVQAWLKCKGSSCL
jgi:hypothetical protein